MLERTLRQPIVAVNVRSDWGVGVAMAVVYRHGGAVATARRLD